MCPQPREERSSWIRDLLARSEGPIHVRLSPDVDVDLPVEIVVGHGPTYIARGMLGLTPSLEDDLCQWQRWWEDHYDAVADESLGSEDEWRSWEQAGTRLVDRLREDLGTGFDVRWA